MLIRTSEPGSVVAGRKESTIHQTCWTVSRWCSRILSVVSSGTSGDDVRDMTAERPERQGPQSSEATGHPHRDGTP